MRLWSLHPRYLDASGLVAAWREALLAQAVLNGRTRGYRHHPQLQRFRQCADPPQSIAAYLWPIHAEAVRRGYRFDAGKIRSSETSPMLPVTTSQLTYEWQHLTGKLRLRAATWLERLTCHPALAPHPLFTVVPGDIAPWEITRDSK